MTKHILFTAINLTGFYLVQIDLKIQPTVPAKFDGQFSSSEEELENNFFLFKLRLLLPAIMNKYLQHAEYQKD